MLLRYWEEGEEQYCKTVQHAARSILGGAVKVLLHKDDACLHPFNPIEKIAVVDVAQKTAAPLDDITMYGDDELSLIIRRAKPLPRPIYTLLSLNFSAPSEDGTKFSFGGKEGPPYQVVRCWDEATSGFVLLQSGGSPLLCHETVTLLVEDVRPDLPGIVPPERSTFANVVEGFSPLRLFGAAFPPWDDHAPGSDAASSSLLGRAVNMGTNIAQLPLAVLPRFSRPELSWDTLPFPLEAGTTGAADTIQRLHVLVRRSVPPERRPDVWPFLTGVDALLKKRPHLVRYAVQKTFPMALEDSRGDVDEALKVAPARHPPFFKGLQPFMNVDLHSEEMQLTKVLLCILAQTHSHIEHCPALPTMLALLISYLEPKVVYAVAHNILAMSSLALRHAPSEDGRCRFLPATLAHHQEELRAFDVLVQRKLPTLYRHGTLLKGDFTQFAADWLSNLFAGSVGSAAAFHIFDVFLVEGGYVLHASGLAILKLAEKLFLRHQSWGPAVRAVREFAATLSGAAIIAQAFDLHLTRDEVDAAIAKVNTTSLMGAQALTPPSLMDGLYFRPAVEPPSRILSEALWESVFYWLPRSLSLSQLTGCYSTLRDGSSLSTLYTKCTSAGPCILLIRAVPASESVTAEAPSPSETIFGAFLSKAPHVSNAYYGDESCFVFTLKPRERQFLAIERVFASTPPPEPVSGDSTPTTANTGNAYYMNGFHTQFLVGGGGGGPALELPADLQSGASFASNTYGNTPLSGSPAFTILALEVYSSA